MAEMVRLGEFGFDGERRLLLRAGAPVPLSPKAFTLLSALLEARPRALSQKELHQRLWPDSFVSPVNLPALVAELRRALGEKGRRGGLIRTVHRFGYALDLPAAEPPCRYRLFWGTRELELSTGENLLGREGPGVLALGDPTVSRRHARILVEPDGVVIEDLGSRNGTFVGARRITAPTPLSDGDRVRLGSVTLSFRRLQPDATTVDA